MKPGQSAGQRVLRSPIKTQLPEPRARRRLRTSYGCDLTQKFRRGGVCRGGVHVCFFASASGRCSCLLGRWGFCPQLHRSLIPSRTVITGSNFPWLCFKGNNTEVLMPKLCMHCSGGAPHGGPHQCSSLALEDLTLGPTREECSPLPDALPLVVGLSVDVSTQCCALSLQGAQDKELQPKLLGCHFVKIIPPPEGS